MTDGIIKGSGNSRFLKSVPDILTRYPTWDAAAAALRDGTFPIDLSGINELGWQVLGTPLNAANLIRIFGRCVTGSYVGTGSTQRIEIGFSPRLFVCKPDTTAAYSGSNYNIILFSVFSGAIYRLYQNNAKNDATNLFSNGGRITETGVEISGSSLATAANVTYYFTAIG